MEIIVIKEQDYIHISRETENTPFFVGLHGEATVLVRRQKRERESTARGFVGVFMGRNG